MGVMCSSFSLCYGKKWIVEFKIQLLTHLLSVYIIEKHAVKSLRVMKKKEG